MKRKSEATEGSRPGWPMVVCTALFSLLFVLALVIAGSDKALATWIGVASIVSFGIGLACHFSPRVNPGKDRP